MNGANKSEMKFKANSSNSNSNNGIITSEEVKKISIAAFKTTVYPITRARCIACHGTTQTPLHAVADAEVAHNALVDTFKVNFNDIPSSRMILKLKEGHNCWTTCANNAAEMQTQITEWKRLIGEKAPDSTDTTVKVPGQITKETNTIEYVLSPDTMVDAGTISFLAESASLKSPMVKKIDTATGLGYIEVPDATSTVMTQTSTTAGTANYSFKLTNGGTYKMFMLVNAPDANSDSAFIKVGALAYKEWHIRATTGFQWREVTVGTNYAATTFAISSGMTAMEIKQRDDGLKISKIIITNDTTFDPNVSTNFKSTIIMPIDELSGVSGSTFSIDIEEFDMYSYKVSSPRIKTTQDLNVKNLKVLVNGSFNPQHSTYTVVNKKVSATDQVVSTFSMILLKDKGVTYDKLSFAFGYIGTGMPPATEPDPTTPTTPTTPVVKLSSVEGFKQTLWPLLRNRCVNCHGVNQAPTHAHADVNVAHTAVIDHSLVNFTNAASSTISNKVKNGHNCWSASCSSDAAEIEGQINIWKNLSGK